MRSEIILRKNYLDKEKIETIYFGGGTPSLLSANELQILIGQITDQFEVTSSAEITLEANPDDLNPQYVKEIKNTLIKVAATTAKTMASNHSLFLVFFL